MQPSNHPARKHASHFWAFYKVPNALPKKCGSVAKCKTKTTRHHYDLPAERYEASQASELSDSCDLLVAVVPIVRAIVGSSYGLAAKAR